MISSLRMNGIGTLRCRCNFYPSCSRVISGRADLRLRYSRFAVEGFGGKTVGLAHERDTVARRPAAGQVHHVSSMRRARWSAPSREKSVELLYDQSGSGRSLLRAAADGKIGGRYSARMREHDQERTVAAYVETALRAARRGLNFRPSRARSVHER